MNRILFLCLSLMLFLPLAAQNSKKVKELQQQQSKLKTELQNSKTQLSKTQKRVKSGQQNVDYLGALVNNRLKRIHELEEELNKLEDDITRMQKDITRIDSELRLRRQRLKAAIRNARVQRENHDPLVFIFSAKTVSQMYRRARYAREYVVYQHNLSGQVLQKQAELLKAQNRLLEAKSRKSAKLNEIMEQRKSLNEQQMQEKERVAGLKKKESGLKGKVAEQQKQIAALDRKIEEVIANEIEQARKKAEEEARKKKAAAKKTPTTKTKQPASTSKPKTETKPATTQKSGSWLTAADRQLNGTFEQNKGRLPVPITGQYMLGNRFGIYNVPGMKNVQLDNKGTDYVGRPGARARAIFDGVVTSVFQFSGTRNVLVRHGSYISVYCNLSSTIVQKGQKVRARDILGTVANDGSGNCTLHFQLRKETTKLNPEAWIGR